MLRSAWTWARTHPLPAAAWAGLALLVACGYAAVHGKLLIHYLDDAWSTSFAWQWIRHGIAQDVIFRDPGTMPLLFGKTHAVALALVAEPFGWTRSHVHLVSTAAVWLTGLCWYGIGRGVGLAREPAAALGFALVLFQPLVTAGNLARPDAVTLLLVSATVLALVRGRWGWAGLAAVLAVECHPMGVMGAAYGLAWAATRRQEVWPDRVTGRRRLAAWIAGAAWGLAWLLWSNRDALSLELLRAHWTQAETFGPDRRTAFTYLHAAFLQQGRIELGVFAGATVVALVRRETRRDPLVWAWLLAVVVVAVGVRRQNGFYVVYAFPALAYLTVRAIAWQPWLLRTALAVLAVTFAVRNGQLAVERSAIDPERTLRQVVAAVPDDGLPVVGLSDFWFGFQERRFVPAAYHGDFARLGLKAFYLVDSDLKPTGFDRLRPALADYRLERELARFPDSATTQVRVVRMVRTAPAPRDALPAAGRPVPSATP